jgi:hypothetical protein
MKKQSRLFGLAIFLCYSWANALTPERGYFERFYRPGPLQQVLLAQARSNKESSEAPVVSADKPVRPAGELGFDNPDLGAPPSSSDQGISAGPFQNLTFGGTLDYRFLFPKEMSEGMFMIHVNEVFLTTNIGDHISVLAEQLLLTSDLSTAVGQDHGFVYVIISNLSFLPAGTAFRIGRMRLKYGIDAKLDAPANPLRTMEYRTLGVISDRAIEVAGYLDFIEYTAAVSMGPDYITKDIKTLDGSVASVKTASENKTHPFIARVGTDFKGTAPNLGFSYYTGKNYKVLSQDAFQAGGTMIFGGFVDERSLVYKERQSVDFRWSFQKLRFSGEYTAGSDSDSDGRRRIEAYYFRTDYTITPQKLTAQIQYDSFYDGTVTSPRFGSIGPGLTYYVTDQTWIRGFFESNEKILNGNSSGGSVAGTQFLVAF